MYSNRPKQRDKSSLMKLCGRSNWYITNSLLNTTTDEVPIHVSCWIPKLSVCLWSWTNLSGSQYLRQNAMLVINSLIPLGPRESQVVPSYMQVAISGVSKPSNLFALLCLSTITCEPYSINNFVFWMLLSNIFADLSTFWRKTSVSFNQLRRSCL